MVLRITLAVVAAVAILPLSTGFTGHGAVAGAARRSSRLSMGLKDMAKKAKVTEVLAAKEELRSKDPTHLVFQYLEQNVAKQGARGPPQERPDTLFKALQKGKGNLSVIAEYRRKMRSGFIKDPLEPELLSPLYRTGGASAVVISTDKNTGGCSASDVVKVISEQKSAAGDFPGPLPCILRDLIVDEFQIANAKALGASAVTLPQGLLGTERMRELQSFTEALGMECLAQVSNAEEISEALSADVKILVVVGKQPSDALELKAGIPEGVVSVVEVPRRSDEGFDEIEDCWAIRDVGFTGVWVCEILYKAGQVQAENVSAIIKAVRAKGSVKYGRARGMSGKGEGAKRRCNTGILGSSRNVRGAQWRTVIAAKSVNRMKI